MFFIENVCNAMKERTADLESLKININALNKEQCKSLYESIDDSKCFIKKLEILGSCSKDIDYLCKLIVGNGRY